MDRDLSGCINWTFTMNILHKISYWLFALAFISGLLTHMVPTFIFFTTAVIVLAVAVYIKDRDNEGRE
jgi:hypothetical protein